MDPMDLMDLVDRVDGMEKNLADWRGLGSL